MSELLPNLTGLFLAIALSAYVLFGGADFGGGILEATLPPPLRKKLEATLAPVWEANHVWLIAVIVILFVGFPKFYAVAMTRLYVPISLALLMVLVRGTFFTLRKYDPEPERWGRLYSALFSRFERARARVFWPRHRRPLEYAPWQSEPVTKRTRLLGPLPRTLASFLWHFSRRICDVLVRLSRSRIFLRRAG